MNVIPKSRKFRHSFRNKVPIYAKDGTPLSTRKIKNSTHFFNVTAWSKNIKLLNLDTENTSNKKPLQIENQAHNNNNYGSASVPFHHPTPTFDVKYTTYGHESNKSRVYHCISLQSQKMTDVHVKGFYKHHHLLFGTSGIMFKHATKVSAKLVNTLKLVISRTLKKHGRAWLRLCCDTPVSARPLETRMGKGKGSVSGWEAKAVPGSIFIEFHGIDQAKLNQLFFKIQKKLGVPLLLIHK